eukprot:2454222-Pyramimonas_sp.AAC.1
MCIRDSPRTVHTDPLTVHADPLHRPHQPPVPSTLTPLPSTPQTETLVTNRRLIARNYVHGWFGLDLISTVPLDVLLDALDSNVAFFSSLKVRPPGRNSVQRNSV